jgi:hypothetical protein
VGVVSILQEKVFLKKIGTTVLNNVDSEADIDWKLNAFMLENITSALKTRSRIQFAVPPHPLPGLNKFYSSTVTMPYLDYDLENIKGQLADLAKQHALDTILLVTSGFSPLASSAGHRAYGQGLYFRTVLLYESLRCYVIAKIQLLDTKTMNPVAHRSLFKVEPTENITWKESYSEYTPSEKAAVEQQIKNIFKERLIEQMTAIGLTE